MIEQLRTSFLSEKNERPFESGEKFLKEMSVQSLDNLKDVIQKLRIQVDDEHEYADIVQVFASSWGKTGAVFVLPDKEKIAGIAVVSSDDNVGKIEAMYVPKEYRKQGIGGSITNAAIQSFMNQGIKKFSINVISPGSRKIANLLKEKYGDDVKIADYGDYIAN